MGSAFMRISAFYESPIWQGKTFTHSDFLRDLEKRESRTEYRPAAGYNLPDYILEQFSDGRFKPLTPDETAMLREVQQRKAFGRYYVIGTTGQEDVIRHEVSHAMFYLDKDYRSEMLSLIKGLSSGFTKNFWSKLRLPRNYYCDKVFEDELIAYLLGHGFYSPSESDQAIIHRMQRVFFQHTIGIPMQAGRLAG